MARKRKTLQQLIIPRLRDLSRYWYEKKEARNAAKVKVEIGTFANGKPKFKVMFRCESCQGTFDIKDTHMDHKVPVIDPDIGFIDWNTYIARLFTTKDNYACLCTECHASKTFLENEIRKEARKLKKSIDNDE